MKRRRLPLCIAALMAAFAIGPAAAQQLPPHPVGAICVTPQLYWCWIPQTAPGAPCACPSPYGPIGGSAR